MELRCNRETARDEGRHDKVTRRLQSRLQHAADVGETGGGRRGGGGRGGGRGCVCVCVCVCVYVCECAAPAAWPYAPASLSFSLAGQWSSFACVEISLGACLLFAP